MWHFDVPKCRGADSGKVEVIARNQCGEAYASTTLTVKPRGDDYRSVLKHNVKREWFSAYFLTMDSPFNDDSWGINNTYIYTMKWRMINLTIYFYWANRKAIFLRIKKSLKFLIYHTIKSRVIEHWVENPLLLCVRYSFRCPHATTIQHMRRMKTFEIVCGALGILFMTQLNET